MYLPSNDLPTYFDAYPPYLNIHTSIGKYLPFLIRDNIDNQYKSWILNSLTSIDSQVDISCCGNDEFFSGNPIFREKVDVKACDFLNAWMVAKHGLHHWLLDVDLKLYLSQCCFWSADDKISCDVAPGLIEIPIPEILKNIRAITYQANIWMNIHPATSTLHYDTNNNLLVMLDGKKDVLLLSPDCTKHLHPVPASDENPNHSLLSPDEVDSIADMLMNQDNLHQNDSSVYRVTLLAGDVLYIPEGWWHQVRSDSCSMALNYWFSQTEEQSLSCQSESVTSRMNAYEMRKKVRSIVQKEREASFGTENVESSAIYHAISFSSFETWLLQNLDKLVSSTKKTEEMRTEQCNDWLEFVTCSFQEMRKLWVPFAEKHPEKWTDVLLSLTPIAAERLLDRWDQLNSAVGTMCVSSEHAAGMDTLVETERVDSQLLDRFFVAIFQPCGDRVSEVRRKLIQQKNKRNEVYARRALSKVLGMDI